MINNLEEWRKIFENSNKPTYLLKKNNDGSMNYMIFTNIDDNKIEIEKGTVGDPKSSKSTGLISKKDSLIRHQKLRGFKEVPSLDIKHVSVSSNDNSATTTTTIDTKKKSFLDNLSGYDRYGVDRSIIGTAGKKQVTKQNKALSVELIEQYKEFLQELKQYADNVDRGKFNSVLLKMNNIIKKDKSIGQILVKNDNDLQNAYQNEINFFNDYLGISEEEYNKLEVKSIKDKIDDSIFLTEVNNISSNIIFEDLNADDDKKINDIIKFSKKYDTRYNYDYIEGYKIINFETQKRFDNDLSKADNKETLLLSHGSRVGNWLNIFKDGLKKEYASTTYYGYGIYFTNQFDKSIGYASYQRENDGNNYAYISIYEVRVGKQGTYGDIPSGGSARRPEDWIFKHGFDSYWARLQSALHKTNLDQRKYTPDEDEFIIYNNDQCTIKYILKFKIN